MPRTPSGDWTDGPSAAVGLALSCPPARVVADFAVAIGTVAGEDRRAARVVASIRMTGATSVAAGATMRATVAAMAEVVEDADERDPAAAVHVRDPASCALVRAATAAELPVAAAATATPGTVVPGPRRRPSARGRPVTVRSAVATPSHHGAPSTRRPARAADPELPARCPGPDPGRTVATEIPTTIRLTGTNIMTF